MRTVIDAITASADGPGSVTVIAARGGTPATLSWSDVHLRARRMSSALAAAGVRRGSRVGLLADTSTDLVVAIQAVWLTGAATTILPPPAGTATSGRLRSLLAIVADAQLDLVVVDSPSAPVGAALSTVTRVTQLSDLERLAATVPVAETSRPDPRDLAVLQYTSGSTGTPRGVPVTHRHLSAQLAAIREVVGHDPKAPHRLLSWLPLHHDLGLIGFLAYPMSGGCPLVLQSPAGFVLRPASWLEALSRHRSTFTGAPDFAYRLLIPLLEAGMAIDLSAVRLMVSGGEPVDPAAMARFTTAAARHGLDPNAIMPAYGLAEATLTVTCSRAGAGLATDLIDPDRQEREGRAVPGRPGGRVRTLARLGRPVRGTQLRIVAPRTGAPAREREIGEVEVRGGSVVGHYWGEPAPPAGAWLRTGDLGYLAEGDLVLCSRSKDVLFAAGRNVYPPDIELAAGQVPGVRPGGAVAFGVPGLPGSIGDRLVVMVEARAVDRPALGRAVTVAVTAETGLRPAEVIALPPGRLPRTTSGKLRRAEARRRYLCGELTGAPANPASIQEGRTSDRSHDRTGQVDRHPLGRTSSGTRVIA